MGKRSGKTPQKKSELLFFEEAERKPMESVVFFRSGHINLTTLRPAITRSIKTVAAITRPIVKSCVSKTSQLNKILLYHITFRNEI